MPTEIPLEGRNGSPLFQVDTQLGDDLVSLTFRWNSRANNGRGSWFMDIRDQDDTPIALGVKLVLGAKLARTSTHPTLLRNVLKLVDTSQTSQEATLDDLGTRVILLNYTAAELYP